MVVDGNGDGEDVDGNMMKMMMTMIMTRCKYSLPKGDEKEEAAESSDDDDYGENDDDGGENDDGEMQKHSAKR